MVCAYTLPFWINDFSIDAHHFLATRQILNGEYSFKKSKTLVISSQRALQKYCTCTPFIRDTNLAGGVSFKIFSYILGKNKNNGNVPNENRFDQKNSILTSSLVERQQQLELWARNTCSYYTVKKGYPFSCPQSLVSDIQAGDGKTANLFYIVLYSHLV